MSEVSRNQKGFDLKPLFQSFLLWREPVNVIGPGPELSFLVAKVSRIEGSNKKHCTFLIGKAMLKFFDLTEKYLFKDIFKLI